MEFFESCNNYEWLLLQALERVEPWGEDRADLRAAFNTSQIIASNRAEKMTNREFNKLFLSITKYLKCHFPDEDD